MLTRDHTVLPATHTFIHKWNEPYLPLLPSRRASPHFGWHLFPVLLRIGGEAELAWERDYPLLFICGISEVISHVYRHAGVEALLFQTQHTSQCSSSGARGGICTRQHFAESSIPKIHDAVYIVCKIFDSNIGIYLF